jgi:uncharacterized protein YciI/uncharacterized protein YndB with AHSA1/START domain
MSIVVPPVKKQLTVKAAQERAFHVFTGCMGRWWPREHHIGKSPMKDQLLEPRVGGRWYATCEDGSECDIGRVLQWEPPHRVVLAWQLTAEWQFDPTFVTEVEVRFTREGEKITRVEFEHRNLERYGAAGPGLRTRFDDPKGWHKTVEEFARVVELKAVVFYDSAPDVLEKAPLHYPAHAARVQAFAARGELIAVGLLGGPLDGSMAVFVSREAAEEFVREDPFVTNRVVAKATIKDWSEILLG